VKALLDEQLSSQIARLLRERGLEVEAIVERNDLPQAPDSEVMEVAAREQRAVVTNNIKDFRKIAAERLAEGRGHAGLILVPSSRGRRRDHTGALANAIEALMRAHPGGIPDAERWISRAG
jgi:Domain of unknown function (DUF5615)